MADGSATRIREHRHASALGRWRVALCTPCPDLVPLVAAFWIGEGSVSYQRDRILPNGQSYLLINLGPPQYLVEASGLRRPFTDIWYSAQRQTPIETEAPHGQCLLGLALQPGAAAVLFDLPAHELTGRILALPDLLGDGVLALRQRLLETPSDLMRFRLVEHWLRQRRGSDTPAVLGEALRRIQASDGQLEVAGLARSLGISRQRLHRLFNHHVGLPAKSLARLQRFQGALALLRDREHVPWVELAAHCGYFDQSHLIRDFRAFSGYAPGEFIRRAMPDPASVVVA